MKKIKESWWDVFILFCLILVLFCGTALCYYIQQNLLAIFCGITTGFTTGATVFYTYYKDKAMMEELRRKSNGLLDLRTQWFSESEYNGNPVMNRQPHDNDWVRKVDHLLTPILRQPEALSVPQLNG